MRQLLRASVSFGIKGTERKKARHGNDHCAGGQPQLRQDDAVQPTYRQPSIRGQLARRDGGAKDRPSQERQEHPVRRPAGYLLTIPVLERGGHLAQLPGRRPPRRHHRHRRRVQPRAQSLPDHAAHGVRRARGGRAQPDGHREEARLHHQVQGAFRTAPGAGRRDIGTQGRWPRRPGRHCCEGGARGHRPATRPFHSRT